MGLLGSIARGLGEVAIGVLGQAWNMAKDANNVRQSSMGMGRDELKKAAVDAYKRKDATSFAGYAQAYSDKYGKK